MPPHIEVCVESVDVAIAAQNAGAHRIELNFGLALDGLTPSPGLVHSVIDSVDIPVIAMARPRAGNFVYSDWEWDVLCKDVTWLLDQGVAGIAFGALDAEGAIHRVKCQEIRDRTDGFELVFHRAFDETAEWGMALDQLIQLGIDRIMTSGQMPSAEEGISQIAKMVTQAGDQIEILPAAGINSLNAARILDQTGAAQIHGSFSRLGKLPDSIASEIKAVIESF